MCHFFIPLATMGLFAFVIAHCFLNVYSMAIDTIFLCFCEDCEKNDGVTKPYFMSKGLMVSLITVACAQMLVLIVTYFFPEISHLQETQSKPISLVEREGLYLEEEEEKDFEKKGQISLGLIFPNPNACNSGIHVLKAFLTLYKKCVLRFVTVLTNLIAFHCTSFKTQKLVSVFFLQILSSSRTSVRVSLMAKYRMKTATIFIRLIFQLNEQDFLCHWLWNVSLILVTSLLDRGLKWSILTSSQWKNKEHLLCFGCACRITFNVTCNRPLLTQSFRIVNIPIILLFSKKWVAGLTDEDNIKQYFTAKWIIAFKMRTRGKMN